MNTLLLHTVGQTRFELIQKLGLENKIENILAEIEEEEMNQEDGWQIIRALLDTAKLEIQKQNEEKSLNFEQFKDLIDDGDFVQASGKLDYSQSGQPSLFVDNLKILTKSLQPIPEKFEDKEMRFRQRYIDMLVNPSVRTILETKGRFWTAVKDFMDTNDFIQVFTPIMQETTGGAEANPFVTHHDALDEDFYLGISPELHLKRMIVGGFEKIYDLGRNFRNEGIDDEHLQEFNRIEFYWAFANHTDLMNFAEDLIKFSLEKAFGSLALIYKPKNEKGDFSGEDVRVNWNEKWPKMSYYDFIKHYGKVDLEDKNQEELVQIAKELGIKVEENTSFGRVTDLIYKKVARPKCINPTWLIDIPTRLSPLAKRDPKNPEITLRSHLLAYGSELTNGFAELNDPLDQLERFEEQQKARDAGDAEAMMIDYDFVNALEIGLPPTVGFGMSERVIDLLLNIPMREGATFPLMRKQKTEKREKLE